MEYFLLIFLKILNPPSFQFTVLGNFYPFHKTHFSVKYNAASGGDKGGGVGEPWIRDESSICNFTDNWKLDSHINLYFLAWFWSLVSHTHTHTPLHTHTLTYSHTHTHTHPHTHPYIHTITHILTYYQTDWQTEMYKIAIFPVKFYNRESAEISLN